MALSLLKDQATLLCQQVRIALVAYRAGHSAVQQESWGGAGQELCLLVVNLPRSELMKVPESGHLVPG